MIIDIKTRRAGDHCRTSLTSRSPSLIWNSKIQAKRWETVVVVFNNYRHQWHELSSTAATSFWLPGAAVATIGDAKFVM